MATLTPPQTAEQVTANLIATVNTLQVEAGVSSFHARVGAVVPATGDYTVAQVTGAAPIASPTFTGVPAAPTAAPLTSTTQLATTAFTTLAVTAAEALAQPIAAINTFGGYSQLVAAPGTASSAGAAGQIAYDATHIYVCVATNTWVRATLATF